MANHLRTALAAILTIAVARGAAAEGLCTRDGWSTVGASGALSGLVMPAAAAPQAGHAALGVGFDFWRGGGFLLPDARTQRTGGALAFSAAPVSCIEVFGSLGLRSTNLFSEASRRTLVSFGDSTLGLKLVAPFSGRFSAGLLAEALFPTGVGGFSMAGTGAHGAALFGLRFQRVAFSVLAGYRFDQSGKLVAGRTTTLPAFAYGLSTWDRAEAAFSVQVPFRWATPEAGVSFDTAVARQAPLPSGERPRHARATLGLTQVATGVPGLTGSAGLQLSLLKAGSMELRELPVEGFAPDAPWTLLAGLSWAFEVPKPRPEAARREPLAAVKAPPAPPVRKARSVLHVIVLDGKTQLPLAGAWVSFLEGSDVGATTGPEGRARVEVDAGRVTLAVAKDGYELLTEQLFVNGNEEKTLSISLNVVAPDSTVRGRLVSEDGRPLRAIVELAVAGSLPALPGTSGVEPNFVEGAFTFSVQHGDFELSAFAPGYRVQALRVEPRPGETVTRDLVMHRVQGEPRARATAFGIEISEPIAFVAGREALEPSAFALLAEIVPLLKAEQRSLVVIARVADGELDDEAEAVRLSESRARAVADYLRDKGVKPSLLNIRGSGVARPGQPLLELRAAPTSAPRAQLSLRGHP